MCGIIVSNNISDIKPLIEKTASRGTIGWSITQTDGDTSTIVREGVLNIETLTDVFVDGEINIIHVQSPTNKTFRHHPSVVGRTMLWHNGMILKHSPEMWDTETIHKSILECGYSALDDIEGSFACVYSQSGHIMYFRNHMSPLFYTEFDNNVVLSSLKLNEQSQIIPPNTVFDYPSSQILSEFNNQHCPYDIK